MDRTFKVLRSGYWYIPFAFPAYVFTGYPYSDEKPALSYFQRTTDFGDDSRPLHHSILRK
jgi:hypothetical protein